jgi:hypothetical protein
MWIMANDPRRGQAGRCPSGKIRYRTHNEAAAGLLRVAERRVQDGHDGTREIQVYRCDTCRGWHLTHQIDYRHPATKDTA